MNCIACRESLLSADRAELRGEVPGALGGHLRSCASCRQVALRLEGSTELLAEMHLARPTTRTSERVGGPSRGRITTIALVPIAAAIAGVWLSGRGSGTSPSVRGPSTLTTSNGVSLQPVAGQKATVIPTSNPKVTIIWLSEGDTE